MPPNPETRNAPVTFDVLVIEFVNNIVLAVPPTVTATLPPE